MRFLIPIILLFIMTMALIIRRKRAHKLAAHREWLVSIYGPVDYH